MNIVLIKAISVYFCPNFVDFHSLMSFYAILAINVIGFFSRLQVALLAFMLIYCKFRCCLYILPIDARDTLLKDTPKMSPLS